MGSFWTRVKGFVSKVVKFVRGKVLPILKPVLPLVQPFLPGVLTPIVSGLQTLEKSPVVKSVIQLQGLTTSPLQGSYQAGEGDYFKITQQVRLCLLDSNDAPIYVDPIANDDSQWQAASESFKYYLNAADQPSRCASVVNVEFSEGKFAETYAEYKANGRPIIYQTRYKVEFDKTNVPLGYQAVLKFDTSVGFVDVTDEDRALMALAEFETE